MYISYNWLKKYIPELDKFHPEEVAKKISWSLAEVEQIYNKGVGLNKIVVGQINEIMPHPSNEKLAIAKVEIGDKKILNIVFASSNIDYVKPTTLYPVCLDGGSIYDKEGKIKKIVTSELGGIVSEGMLCSISELGLDDEKKGITLIEDNMPLGKDLTVLLQDYIFEIENKSVTHRPDCFSHKGIAREISAMFDIEFIEKTPTEAITNEKDKVKVSVIATDGCSRFTCNTMRDVIVKSSPTWLKIMLYYIGQKPVNNIVDISNYIMYDIGQPMHIYDLDKMGQGDIYVRKAKKGEKLQAINHKNYDLSTNHLVIATKDTIEGIAGIMGALGGEVTETTKNILIEAANFDMFSIRKTGMELGLQSDANIRFSKGLTNIITREAVIEATKLFEDLADAELSSQLTDEIIKLDQEKIIEFNLNNIKRIGGINIDKTKIIAILNSLGIKVEGAENLPSDLTSVPNADVRLIIPAFRKDLNITQDIVEEVIRIYGYDRIIPDLPIKTIIPTKQNTDYEFSYKLKHILALSDVDEVYNYSFIGSKTYTKANLKTNHLLKVINAIAPELEFFRANLLPSLLEKVSLNSGIYDDFAIFELGREIIKTKQQDVPLHRKMLGIIQYCKTDDANKILKLKLDRLFMQIGIRNYSYKNIYSIEKSNQSDFEKEQLQILHPNQAVRINIAETMVGIMGSINPVVKNNYNFEANISIAYIDYKTLFELYEKTNPDFLPINYFPIVYRDINFNVSEINVDIAEIIGLLGKLDTGLANWHVDFLDYYISPNSQEKYLTLRFAMQKGDGTLSESEIASALQLAKKTMQEKLNISERY